MKVLSGFEEARALTRPVVAIGSFDGVHLGHRRVLGYLCDYARHRAGDSVVVTFDPHPQELLRPDSDFFRINSLERNLELMASAGVDAVVVIPFTKAFSRLTYRDFIEQYIIKQLKASTLVMGPNHAFGHNREGRREAIEALCTEQGVEVVELPEVICHDIAVHSAEIRRLIREERWQEADELLGYHYSKENK